MMTFFSTPLILRMEAKVRASSATISQLKEEKPGRAFHLLNLRVGGRKGGVGLPLNGHVPVVKGGRLAAALCPQPGTAPLHRCPQLSLLCGSIFRVSLGGRTPRSRPPPCPAEDLSSAPPMLCFNVCSASL